MFIFSVKPFKNKILIATGLALFILILCVLIGRFINNDNTAISKNGEYNLCAKDNETRITFLSQFSWEVQAEPLEECEILIPGKFNDTYERYNDIQKEQGLDLSHYKNKKCKRYTYQVLNYKNVPGGIRANLLVYNNKVIGGDISSVELGGFMHGFAMPSEIARSELTYNNYSTSKVNAVPSKKVEIPTQTTYKENLEIDPKMPQAPVD